MSADLAMSDKITTKAVLVAVLEWKRHIDESCGVATCAQISKDLYAVINAWQMSLAEKAIEEFEG